MKLSRQGKTRKFNCSRSNMAKFGKYNLSAEREAMRMTQSAKSVKLAKSRAYVDLESWIAIGVIGVVVLVILLFVGCWGLKMTSGISAEYSRGERTGTIYKVSDATGWMFKTVECEMNLGGAVNTEGKGLVANTWTFSIIDQSIKTNLQHYSETGQRITVTYTQPWLMPYRTGDSGYLVTSVKTNTPYAK
jgi:hypothetical protein